MAGLPEVNFVPSDWGPEIEGWLHGIADFDSHVETMRERIESGEYQALTIAAGGQSVGAMVWSVERDPTGAVVVVNALACRPVKGVDMSRVALAFVAALGRSAGAVAVRFWTQRRGLVRKMQKFGFVKTYVLEGRL